MSDIKFHILVIDGKDDQGFFVGILIYDPRKYENIEATIYRSVMNALKEKEMIKRANGRIYFLIDDIVFKFNTDLIERIKAKFEKLERNWLVFLRLKMLGIKKMNICLKSKEDYKGVTEAINDTDFRMVFVPISE